MGRISHRFGGDYYGETFNFFGYHENPSSDEKNVYANKWTHCNYQIHVLTIALNLYTDLYGNVSIYYW